MRISCDCSCAFYGDFTTIGYEYWTTISCSSVLPWTWTLDTDFCSSTGLVVGGGFSLSEAETMSKDYGSWSLADLKTELRKRNAKLTGKKAVLVQRLQDHDKLFGPLITDPEAVYKITLPEPEQFRDVTSSSHVPSLSFEDLRMFGRLTERENIDTSRNMYNEYFLMSCRLAEASGDYFVTGMVCSEMRKNIIYNVAIKLKSHFILEAQCECAAGMGPYGQCKHILVLLFGIVDHSEKKTIKLKESATSRLQTFHQPRKLHTGDPVKAEDLALKFNDKTYKEMLAFDPRPTIENKEKYIENFKSAVANYCGQSKETSVMPIAQIIKPADKKSIFADHDYFEKTQEEKFLEDLILNEAEIKELEENTRNDINLWKKERLRRLQSSNFGKICKMTGDGKKLAASLIKYTNVSSPSIKHGLKYEEEAIQKFEDEMLIKTEKCGIMVHNTYQFLACTPDRLVGSDSVLEVKCPYTAKDKNISPETVPYLYLCENGGVLKLDESHNYYYQVQGQLLCTGRKTAYFCVYTIKDCQIIMIERNDSFIEKMVQKLKLFYEEYFVTVLLNRYLYSKK